MDIYTMDDWSRDHNLSAKAGQEVAPEIYEQMFDVMPPLRLAAGTALNRKLGIVKGFRVGEPYAHGKSLIDGKYMAFYEAFGKTSDGRCFCLGKQNKYGELFDPDTGNVIENK